MIGEGMDFDFLTKYAKDLGIPEKTIEFTGLLEGEELAWQMASADLMVVFSNYENFPVVINESFALGIPVVATRVGGIPEFINETNGRLLDAGDQNELENLLNNYLDGQLRFDREKIMVSARKKFSSEEIGKELYHLYRETIKTSL
jgi:glycosyltransferase involved in cell wall biosynthesis